MLRGWKRLWPRMKPESPVAAACHAEAAVAAEGRGRQDDGHKQSQQDEQNWRVREHEEDKEASKVPSQPRSEAWDPARWWSHSLSQGARWVEQRVIGAMEVRGESFEDVLEWQIGRLHLRGLEIVHNGAPFSLADEGWELRGFVGSCWMVPAASPSASALDATACSLHAQLVFVH